MEIQPPWRSARRDIICIGSAAPAEEDFSPSAALNTHGHSGNKANSMLSRPVSS